MALGIEGSAGKLKLVAVEEKKDGKNKNETPSKINNNDDKRSKNKGAQEREV
ncbi:MAG: hypothetical protein Q7U36_03720 [bacterium]|nr:hypothetical protein [bacterium]